MDDILDNRMGRLPDPADAAEAGYYSGVNAKRLLAWVLDVLLIGLVGMLLLPLTGFLAVFFLPVWFLIVGFLYRTWTLASGSATWGMRIAGMELRREDGTKFDLGTAVLHTLLYTVAVAVAPLQLISVILMLVTERKQGLHDMVLSTAPIRSAL